MSIEFFNLFQERELPPEVELPEPRNPTVSIPKETKMPSTLWWEAKFWEDLGEKIKNDIEKDMVAVVTHVTAQAIRFNPRELEQLKEKNKQTLQVVTEAEHLNNLLIACVPAIIEQVRPEIEALDCRVTKEYLKGQMQTGGLLFSLFEVLLPQIFCNLADQLAPQEPAGHRRLLAIFPQLAELFKMKYADIDQQMRTLTINIDAALPIEKRKAILLETQALEIAEIFAPLSKALLKVALPKGPKELPVVSPLDIIIFKIIKTKLIPDLLLDFYLHSSDFHIERGQATLQATPHGEILDRLVEAVPLAIDAFGLPLMEKCSSLIADEIVKGLPESSSKEPMHTWLEQLLSEFTHTECLAVQEMITKLSVYAQAFVSQIFISIADSQPGQLSIFSQMLGGWRAFIAEHQNEIDSRLLAHLTVESAFDDLKSLFEPVLEQMLAKLKIQQPADLPIPKYFQAMAFEAMKKEGIKALVYLYQAQQAEQRKDENVQLQLQNFYGAEFPSLCSALDRFLIKNIDSLSANSALISNIISNSFSTQLIAWNPAGKTAIPTYLQQHMPALQALFQQELEHPSEEAKELLLPLLRSHCLRLLAGEVNLSAEQQQALLHTRASIAIEALNGAAGYFAELQQQFERPIDQHQLEELMHIPAFIDQEDRGAYTQHYYQLSSAKSSLHQLLERYEHNADLESIRADLEHAYRQMQEAQKEIDAIQKSALKNLARKIMPLIGLDEQASLGMPAVFANGIKDIIAGNALPGVLLGIYNAASDNKIVNQLLLQALQGIHIEPTSHDADELESVYEAPDDALQQRLKDACTAFISQMTGSQNVLIRNLLQGAGVNMMASALRQQLCRPQFKDVITYLGADEPLLQDISHTDETNNDPALKLLAELRLERELNLRIENEIVSKLIDGASHPMYALDKAWKTLIKKLEQPLACFGSFGHLIKKIIDALVQVIFFQVIGTILSYLFKPLYDRGLSILAESVVKENVRRLLQAVHMNINKNLLYRISNDIVDHLNRV